MAERSDFVYFQNMLLRGFNYTYTFQPDGEGFTLDSSITIELE